LAGQVKSSLPLFDQGGEWWAAGVKFPFRKGGFRRISAFFNMNKVPWLRLAPWPLEGIGMFFKLKDKSGKDARLEQLTGKLS
jgi:hypothetical protein